MAKLQISGVTKSYGALRAVDRVTLDVAAGETIVLLGPSGCGKTTLLRMIAGFIRPEAGSISIAGRLVASDTVMVPPERRSLSMVFQSYAVWPHKTVFENLSFGLKLRRLDRATIETKVASALAMVRMESYAARYPAELSGGQQQRVALARALVLEPEILLFDEPLSNLDASLREHMRFEIKTLLTKLSITSIYVTHDQHEAMVIADRIAVMSSGRIEQLATAEELYHRSRTEFVARFIGLANVLDAEVVRAPQQGYLAVRSAGLGEVVVRDDALAASPGTAVRLVVRPESIILGTEPSPDANSFVGRVIRSSFLGAHTDFLIDVGGTELRAISPGTRVQARPGEDVRVNFRPADAFVLATSKSTVQDKLGGTTT